MREGTKEQVEVSLHGCDDSTIFSVELEKYEIKTLHKIAELSKKTSQYGCQPVLEYSILERDN